MAKENEGQSLVASDVEALEREIEPGPDSGGLIATTKASAEDIYWLADNIEKIIDSQNRIRLALLKLAQPGDWVTFGSKEAKKAEIGFAGANRIGSTLGISYLNWNAEKIVDRDEKGEWYRWEFTCDAVFRNTRIRVYGRAGSRDKFFGKEKGAYKPLHEVREDDIKCAAMRAAKKEGVRDLLGLHHMDPEFLKKNGINLASAGGYEFKNDEAQAADVQTVNIKIGEILSKTGKGANGPWTKYTIVDVDGAGYSTFSDSIATEAKKQAEAKTLVKIDFKPNEKYGPEIVSLNGITGNSK